MRGYYEQDYQGQDYNDLEAELCGLDQCHDFDCIEVEDDEDEMDEMDENDAYNLGSDEFDPMDGTILLNASDDYYKVHSAQEIYKNFHTYVELERSGDIEKQKYARECACRDLEGFIINVMNKRFKDYIRRDPSFAEDLIQAGRQGIILSLGKYNPERSAPTTYFFNQIRHEMVDQVNEMVHETKSHMATTKHKMAKVDKLFAKYGRTPDVCDYVDQLGIPWRRIVNAMHERSLSSVKSSIDDKDSAPIIDRQANTRSPEEEAISNYNAARIIKIAQKVEPNPTLLACFTETYIYSAKISDLARKYNIPASDITTSNTNILNLLKFSSEIRKMYPDRSKVDESELMQSIAVIPIEEGEQEFQNILESLTDENEDYHGDYGENSIIF